MTLRTINHSWAETVALFEQRNLPVSGYENLYNETYDVHTGDASISGDFVLDGADLAGTGYVIDGDLTVGGNIVNLDDGCPALIVLGDLRAGNIYLEGDVKLLVRGTVHVDAFIGNTTDKLVIIHGDLRASVTVLSDEFSPDLIGGELHGGVIAPPYLELAQDRDPATLLVPEVLVTDEDDDDDDDRRGFDAPRVHGGRLLQRIEEGLPVARCSRPR
ncbi:polymer-forming cytoskeletal protein [Embleya scabrispora]|uniref:polymer-forming cytoskeletal protein n=1 Tax=Embleya scabrispora TaxID=159449 RepID=UPI00037BF451|nr:polymer-forming cytoskeletal protein [Embleya scabrispora]MYS86639.1 hypothetical protein [Streptomyces sp. SID5474]